MSRDRHTRRQKESIENENKGLCHRALPKSLDFERKSMMTLSFLLFERKLFLLCIGI